MSDEEDAKVVDAALLKIAQREQRAAGKWPRFKINLEFDSTIDVNGVVINLKRPEDADR